MHRSPILHALAIMLILFAVSFFFLPADLVNDVLDCYAIAAGACVVARYGKQIYAALQKARPDGTECLLVSIGGIAVTISALRMLREFGLELGIIESLTVQYAFAMITVVMVFALFLKVIAPPLPLADAKINVGPWYALALALASGTSLSAIVLAIRYL